MDKQFVEEVKASFDNERITYHYFKDKYCYFLLSHALGKEQKVSDIKKGNFGRFCGKPAVQQVLARLGSNTVDASALDAMWSASLLHFNLTLGHWGGENPSWQQTCRKGFNLVLQLNFSKSHDRDYERIRYQQCDPFTCYGHPVRSGHRNTLAWSRIDLSDDLEEALVEEVQSDWVKRACSLKQIVNRLSESDSIDYWGVTSEEAFTKYFERHIKPLEKVWEEAMLSATLEFLVQQIGVKKVYYHDFETGAKMKQIRYRLPPRSLYTRLPKQFGFVRTEQAPDLVLNDKFARWKLKKITRPYWNVMNF